MTDDTGVEARTGQDGLTLAVEGDVPVGHRLREVLDGTSDAAGTSVSAMTCTPKNLSYRLSIAHCKIVSSVWVIDSEPTNLDVLPVVRAQRASALCGEQQPVRMRLRQARRRTLTGHVDLLVRVDLMEVRLLGKLASVAVEGNASERVSGLADEVCWVGGGVVL
jgi:hypothetical protein